MTYDVPRFSIVDLSTAAQYCAHAIKNHGSLCRVASPSAAGSRFRAATQLEVQARPRLAATIANRGNDIPGATQSPVFFRIVSL